MPLINLTDEELATIKGALQHVRPMLGREHTAVGQYRKRIDAALEALTRQPATVGVPQPDWSKAEDWARYWTSDASGRAMWWENKPIYDGRSGIWMGEDEGRRAAAGVAAAIYQRPAPGASGEPRP